MINTNKQTTTKTLAEKGLKNQTISLNRLAKQLNLTKSSAKNALRRASNKGMIEYTVQGRLVTISSTYLSRIAL